MNFKLEANRIDGGTVVFNAAAVVATRDDAVAAAALFPKYARVHATTMSGKLDPDGEYRRNSTVADYRTFGYIKFQVIFESTGGHRQ
jgi:hypothetical protein